MIKKLGITLALASSLAVVVQAQAGCITINPTLPPNVFLMPANCASITNTLSSSGQFPNIFSSSQASPSLCFASVPNSGLTAKFGTKYYNVSTISAVTNEFNSPLVGGTDPLAGIVTQWEFKDSNGNLFGRIFTHDTVNALFVIDPTTGRAISTELDVIVGGTGFFNNSTTGALRVDSILQFSPTGLQAININDISGNICSPSR